MTSKLKLILLLAFGLALNPLAFADDDDDTIDMAENGDTEAGFVAQFWPNENVDFGPDVSDMARDPEYQGREFGEWVSGQVRQDVNQDRKSVG